MKPLSEVIAEYEKDASRKEALDRMRQLFREQWPQLRDSMTITDITPEATPASTGAEPCQHTDMWRRDLLLSWRGIDPSFGMVCRDCSGSGVKTYGSTSTWRGGIGGQMMTSDVCDRCWGSGCSDQPWTNLRKLKAAHPSPADEAVRLLRRMRDYDPERNDPLAAQALKQWAGEALAALTQRGGTK